MLDHLADRSRFALAYRRRYLYPRLARHLRGRVLDVGCGAGHWGQRVATLRPEGASISGIDHEPGFLPNDPYHLSPGSPLVDLGTAEAATIDIDQKARPTVGATTGVNTKLMDIGADETNN